MSHTFTTSGSKLCEEMTITMLSSKCNHLPATSFNCTCENSSCCISEEKKPAAGGRSGVNVLVPQSGSRPRQHRPVSVSFPDLDESTRNVRRFTEMRCVRQTVLKPMRRNGRLVLKELKSSSKAPPDYWQSYQAIHPLGNTRRKSRTDDDHGGSKSRHRWSVELGSLPPLISHHLSPSDTINHKSRVLLRSASLPEVRLMCSETAISSNATALRSRLATELERLVSAAAKTIALYRPRRFGASEAMELEVQVRNSVGCREVWDGISSTRNLRLGKADVIRK